jgi:hypothetical protein
VNKGQGLALAGLAFVGLFVIRDAVVRASMPDRPAYALLVWPGHPDALIAERMTAIGQAAAAKHPVDDALTGPVIEAVRRSPLRIEPFLVAAVKAQTSGHEAAAQRPSATAPLRCVIRAPLRRTCSCRRIIRKLASPRKA